MDRRLFGIGLLLFIIGIALAYFSVQSLFSGIPSYISATESLSLRPASYLAVPIIIANESILQIAYNSTVPIDFFLMNSTAYNKTAESGNALIENTAALDGNGLIFEIINSTHGTFPYAPNISLSRAPAYSNNQTIVERNHYYAVFQNHGNSTGTVFYTILNRSISSISSSAEGYSYGNEFSNILGTLSFIAGIILMFYGLFMKPKKAENAEDEYAKMLYRRMEQRPKLQKAQKRLKRTGNRKTVYIKSRRKR